MKSFQKQVKNLIIGIKYKKAFKIQDISGQIIDHILNNSKSPFDQTFFPNLAETSNRKKILKSDDGSTIRITEDEIVLILSTNEENVKQRFDLIKEKLIVYFEKYLFPSFGINNIARIGVMFEINAEKTNLIEEKIKGIVGEKKVHNIVLTFSEKLPTDSAMAQKDVFDYININYIIKTVTDDDANLLSFEYDYQKIFEPVINTLAECNLSGIYNTALNELEKSYDSFFSNYIVIQDDKTEKETKEK